MLTFFVYALPVIVVVFFGTSLFLFCRAKIKNKRVPGSVSDIKINDLKTMLVVASVMMVILLLAVVALSVLTAMILAYM